MRFQLSSFWIPAFAMAAGLTLAGSDAHAQCSNMMARTAIAWNALPDDMAGAFRTAPRAQHSDPADRGGDSSIVGLWKVTFTSGGQVVDQAFETFHSDGTEMMVDTAPPASDNVCVGVWARVNGANYKLNHPSWTFDHKGNLNGTAVIRVNVVIGPNSNSFTGTFTVDVYNLTGGAIDHLAGTVAGQRVEVD